MSRPVIQFLYNQSVSVYSAQSQTPSQPVLPLVSDPVCDSQRQERRVSSLGITSLLVSESVQLRVWRHDSMDCLLWFWRGVVPPAPRKGVSPGLDGKMEHELGRQFGAESNEILWCTSPSIFQPATSFRKWLKEQDTSGWDEFGGYRVWRRFSFVWKGASWGGSGTWLGSSWAPSFAPPGRRHPRAEPGLAGGIIYLMWSGNTSGSPRRSEQVLLVRGTSGKSCWACWHRGRRGEMDDCASYDNDLRDFYIR